MKNKMGCSSRAWASVRLLRKGEVKLVGHLKLFVGGKKVLDEFNDVTDDFKNESAKGAALGTFNKFTGGIVKLIDSGAAEYDRPVTLDAGGTGAEDYVKYTFSWQNTTGVSKTINTAQFFDDSETIIYCQKTGLTYVVPDQQTIGGEWTVTVAFSSGGVTDLYRNNLAKMFNLGTFTIPAYIVFVNTLESELGQVASLEDGGTGAENYHQWTATYTATGDITIDILALSYNDELEGAYTEDDIVDKTLALDEELIGRVRVTHN